MAKTDYKKPDHYARKAKKRGFQARSVFKLEEVDEKEGLLRPGVRVLDLDAAPGSWMQYASLLPGLEVRWLDNSFIPLSFTRPILPEAQTKGKIAIKKGGLEQ